MKHFYIVANESKDNTIKKQSELAKYIISKGGTCTTCGEVPEEVECILVLGGDGTFLRASKNFGKLNKPLMGINMGSLGFLTMTEIADAEKAIDELLADRYNIDHRIKLNCSVKGKEAHTALNDVVIAGGGYSHIVGIEVYVNNQLFGSYEGDGIIISTPTGSTGYNLSAGGPIVTPNVNAMIITPICPHALNARSFIISGDDEVKVKMKGNKHRITEPAYVTVDGDDYATVETENEVYIKKSEFTCNMIMLPSVSFIDTLNSKIN